jgi:hypothetical protein
MKAEPDKFLQCLLEAEALLDEYTDFRYESGAPAPNHPRPQRFDLALIEQWAQACKPGVQGRAPVRLLQQMACTGGTLISKCLAAMPNVALLSEVNPLSQLGLPPRPRFAPTNLIELAYQAKIPLMDELSEKMFRADIEVISNHLHEIGQHLVIREHSHSDFMVGESTRRRGTIKDILEKDFQVLAALLVRHPVDSYLSLVNNGWLHFEPATFDEYCRRYLLFLECSEEVTLYKYEDFVDNPQTEMKRMCETLQLTFSEEFREIFDFIAFSGDSGRASDAITRRERREFTQSFAGEVNESNHFARLCADLHYEPRLDWPADTLD